MTAVAITLYALGGFFAATTLMLFHDDTDTKFGMLSLFLVAVWPVLAVVTITSIVWKRLVHP